MRPRNSARRYSISTRFPQIVEISHGGGVRLCGLGDDDRIHHSTVARHRNPRSVMKPLISCWQTHSRQRFLVKKAGPAGPPGAVIQAGGEGWLQAFGPPPPEPPEGAARASRR